MKSINSKHAVISLSSINFLLIGTICMFLICTYWITANAQELTSEDVYTHAPSPHELAEKLYKVRYRTIVINDDTVQQKQENLFAMLINFEFDSTQIMPQSYPLLDSVGQMLNLQSVAGKQIIIEGHTDSIGNDRYNLSLSQRRALAIKDYLANNYNVSPERMVTTGKGEAELFNPLNPHDKVNRRVQFRPHG